MIQINVTNELIMIIIDKYNLGYGYKYGTEFYINNDYIMIYCRSGSLSTTKINELLYDQLIKDKLIDKNVLT